MSRGDLITEAERDRETDRGEIEIERDGQRRDR